MYYILYSDQKRWYFGTLGDVFETTCCEKKIITKFNHVVRILEHKKSLIYYTHNDNDDDDNCLNSYYSLIYYSYFFFLMFTYVLVLNYRDKRVYNNIFVNVREVHPRKSLLAKHSLSSVIYFIF